MTAWICCRKSRTASRNADWQSAPPYNLGKEYEKRLSLDTYLEQQRRVISECARILHAQGSICWQVGNYVDNGEIIPLDVKLYPIFEELGMHMRNRIIWHFGHGLHASRRFSGRYEVIIWFTKSDEYTVEVQFGKYAFMFYDLAKFQYFFNENKCDVGVEIVPCHDL